MAALSLRSNSFLTNLRNVGPSNFFSVKNTDVNPILHRRLPFSDDLQNKSAVLSGPLVTMDRALEHSHATVLFHLSHTAQNRPVLRTKSTVSVIFATLLPSSLVALFLCVASGTFGVKL